jgi:hypothetical protein
MQQQTDMLPLTEKDLAYMHDMMSWELLATKKAYQYAQQTMDADCRNLMFQVAEQHQRNLERVLMHLEQHVATQPSSSAAIPSQSTMM